MLNRPGCPSQHPSLAVLASPCRAPCPWRGQRRRRCWQADAVPTCVLQVFYQTLQPASPPASPLSLRISDGLGDFIACRITQVVFCVHKFIIIFMAPSYCVYTEPSAVPHKLSGGPSAAPLGWLTVSRASTQIHTTTIALGFIAGQLFRCCYPRKLDSLFHDLLRNSIKRITDFRSPISPKGHHLADTSGRATWYQLPARLLLALSLMGGKEWWGEGGECVGGEGATTSVGGTNGLKHVVAVCVGADGGNGGVGPGGVGGQAQRQGLEPKPSRV